MKLTLFITFGYLVWTVASEIDCDQADNINEGHIHLCCKHPEDENETVDSCAKETNFRMPSAQDHNVLDLTADGAISATCFSDCILNKMHFIKDHKLDMVAIKAYYEKKYSHDAEYASEMINAFDHCHGTTQRKEANFLMKHMPHSCNTNSSVILGCVVKQFFHNCPRNRWAQTQECKDTLEFSKSCPDAFASL
ncbi:uncharacterized protein LOC117566584 [Drosophila albomicans]|uniref:Uncharacterized protein LOC117566584 n=1 Tax=Drosophila albomicans TaxID=7291 RepID=A0A6P8XX87_DROAB|nr:uncharacterized protein LOC117566584 [Drosophila albomicans]